MGDFTHWNYRVVHATVGGETMLSIIEAFYGEDGSVVAWAPGSLDGWTDMDDLRATLDLMALATQKAVLTNSDLPGVR